MRALEKRKPSRHKDMSRKKLRRGRAFRRLSKRLTRLFERLEKHKHTYIYVARATIDADVLGNTLSLKTERSLTRNRRKDIYVLRKECCTAVCFAWVVGHTLIPGNN